MGEVARTATHLLAVQPAAAVRRASAPASTPRLTVTLGSARLEIFVSCRRVCCIRGSQNSGFQLVIQFGESCLEAKRLGCASAIKPLGTTNIVYFACCYRGVFGLRTGHVAATHQLALQGVLFTSVGRVCELYSVQTGCSLRCTSAGILELNGINLDLRNGKVGLIHESVLDF